MNRLATKKLKHQTIYQLEVDSKTDKKRPCTEP